MWQILTVVGITFFGMLGGQGFKLSRRYLLPTLASLYAATKKKEKIKSSFYLMLIGILSMGYGENSKLRKLFDGNDTLTRIAYGILVSLPFLFFGKWYACIALPIAWSIKAGAFPITKTKDFLWEDFIRYSTIGVLVVV